MGIIDITEILSDLPKMHSELMGVLTEIRDLLDKGLPGLPARAVASAD